jgi:hypothetical protein
VDLQKLWKDLGVSEGKNQDAGAELDPHAPLAQIRDAIMAPVTTH